MSYPTGIEFRLNPGIKRWINVMPYRNWVSPQFRSSGMNKCCFHYRSTVQILPWTSTKLDFHILTCCYIKRSTFSRVSISELSFASIPELGDEFISSEEEFVKEVLRSLAPYGRDGVIAFKKWLQLFELCWFRLISIKAPQSRNNRSAVNSIQIQTEKNIDR